MNLAFGFLPTSAAVSGFPALSDVVQPSALLPACQQIVLRVPAFDELRFLIMAERLGQLLHLRQHIIAQAFYAHLTRLVLRLALHALDQRVGEQPAAKLAALKCILIPARRCIDDDVLLMGLVGEALAVTVARATGVEE